MDTRQTIATISVPQGAISAALLFVRDLDGTIRYWSEGLKKLYGYDSSEALGRKAHELLQTEFPLAEVTLADELEAMGTWSGELLQRRKNGEPVVVVSQWILTPTSAGSLITETCNDISMHRQTADYLAAIVQSTDDAIIGTTLDGLITSC